MRLRYTPRAKLDLSEIHDYIAQENPQAARHVILLIRKAAETLPQNPQIGRMGRIAGTRELINRWPFPVHACLSHRVGRDTGLGISAYRQIVAGKFLMVVGWATGLPTISQH